MIRPISIALVYGGRRSYQYAKIMKELIVDKSSQFPLIPLLVDGSERNGGVMTAIKQTFEPSNRAMIFISEEYSGYRIEEREDTKGKKNVGMTTPNLMFELGYLYRKLGEDSLKIITDFPYDDVHSKFCFPSDLNGQYLCAKKELKVADTNKIKEILSEILEAELRAAFEKDGLRADQNIFMDYDPQIETLFSREIADGINGYSLEKQHITVMNNWMSELNKLSRMIEIGESAKEDCIILYCYERLLFLLAFHDTQIEKIDVCNLKITTRMSRNIMQRSEAKLFNMIVEYIVEHRQEMEASFYIGIAKKIERLIGNSKFNFLVAILVKNYLGLCYLNYAMKKTGAGEVDDAMSIFKKAKECFDEVIDQAEHFVGGTLMESVLRSFAYYNRARALSGLNIDNREEWRNDFIQAMVIREKMCAREEFPEFVRLYFRKELYHCINGETYEVLKYYERKTLTMPNDERTAYSLREREVLDKLKEFEQTSIAGNPFFEKVKKNAMGNLEKLSC